MAETPSGSEIEREIREILTTPENESPSAKFGFRRGSKAARFLDIAQPDDEGFSRYVAVEELDEDSRFGNGVDWARPTSKIANTFNIQIEYEGGRTVGLKLNGFKKQELKKPVPVAITREIKAQRCPVLGTSSDIQCDHKDGRLDDPRLNDASRVTIDDFQPLSRAANTAKRQVCKECRETNLRFDATRLGFTVAQFKGNGVYRGTCIGCYWHDVRRFHAEVSDNAPRA